MRYSPKLPLQLDETDNFVIYQDVIENHKQAIKMILLTNPGEKIMDPDFGIGVMKYLFENASSLVSLEGSERGSLSSQLASQLYKYNSDIILEDLKIKTEENYMMVHILFSYLGFSDILSLRIDIPGYAYNE